MVTRKLGLDIWNITEFMEGILGKVKAIKNCDYGFEKK